MGHLKALCEGPGAPYPQVVVLPHLDHADPKRDRWALTEGLPHLASVMFDAQSILSTITLRGQVTTWRRTAKRSLSRGSSKN